MSELSRKSFLKGSGALVAGLSLAPVAKAANNPGAASAYHAGALPGPPDPTQIDSWLQVNPDNTVTLFHGWAEMGQGSPTAVRMIAAEELGLSIGQVGSAQVDTNVSISSFAAGSSSTLTAMGAGSMRGAAAATRTLLVNMASAQLGVPAAGLVLLALVAVLASRPIHRLLKGVDGEHAEGCRDPCRRVDRCDATRRLTRDVVEVGGVAADHGPEADHGVDATVLRDFAGSNRSLEGARHPRDHDVIG